VPKRWVPPARGRAEQSPLGLRLRHRSGRPARRQAVAERAAGREAGQATRDLVPGPHRKTERARHAVAADRNLAHLFGHLPDGAAAGGEVCHIARPEPVNSAHLIGDENLAGNDLQDFIDRVAPGEPARRARPHGDRRRAVGAFRQALGTRLRSALDDPIGSASNKCYQRLGSSKCPIGAHCRQRLFAAQRQIRRLEMANACCLAQQVAAIVGAAR
jgi:hypothetical protein